MPFGEGEGQMTELRSCPFCGGEARITELTYPMKHYTVICSNEKCYAQMGDFLSKGEAIEKWNNRWMIPCEEGETEGNWHTGTPTEEGWYVLVIPLTKGLLMYETDYLNKDGKFRLYGKRGVIAWQKIEPYKEIER